jgi:hypothetical protein
LLLDHSPAGSAESGPIVEHHPRERGNGAGDQPPRRRIIAQAGFKHDGGAGRAESLQVKILAVDNECGVACDCEDGEDKNETGSQHHVAGDSSFHRRIPKEFLERQSPS